MKKRNTNGQVLAPYFGKTFIDDLAAPRLVVGRDQLNRDQLAEIGITHFGACRMLSELAAELKAVSVRDLYKRMRVGTLARERGKGLACLYVAWKLFEAYDLSSTDWYVKGRKGALVTFHSIKRQETLTAKRSKRKSGGRQEFKPTTPSNLLEIK